MSKTDRDKCYPTLNKYGFAQARITAVLVLASAAAIAILHNPSKDNPPAPVMTNVQQSAVIAQQPTQLTKPADVSQGNH